jgi:hypothetical protein
MLFPYLPFDRGATMSHWNVFSKTLDANSWLGLAGQRFWVRDTVHETGAPVCLIALKNGAAALTVAKKFVKLSTASAEYRAGVITGYNDTAGGVCIALDDQYTVGKEIPAYDIFFGVLIGPVKVTSEASAVSLTAGDPVASDASGLLDGASATAGQYVVGTVDQDAAATDTDTLIYASGNLSMPPAAG